MKKEDITEMTNLLRMNLAPFDQGGLNPKEDGYSNWDYSSFAVLYRILNANEDKVRVYNLRGKEPSLLP